MKKLFALVALVGTFALMSCSESQSPSFITNPSLEKAEIGFTDLNSSKFPYLKLTQFKEVEKCNYYSESGVNKLYIELPASLPNVLHFYVVIEHSGSIAAEIPATVMLFVENNYEKVLEIDGFNEAFVYDVNVYAYSDDNSQQEVDYPFYNFEQFQSLQNVCWETQKYDIQIKCDYLLNTELVFVNIDTENGSYLLFWGKPLYEGLTIENFGEPGVTDVKLFGRFTYFYDSVNRVN